MFASSRCRLGRRALLGAFALALAVSSSDAPLRAQGGERITLPRRPSPNQTLTVRLTQDMDMQMTMAPAEAGGGGQPQGMPPMKVNGSMMMAATQKVGEPDDQGRTPCEFKYTDASMDMKMNGMSLPSEQFRDQFVGKSMSFAYAPDGSVTDVKMPDTPGAAGMKSTVQQALSAFTMSLPTQPLAVGESAKMPVTIPLALPMPGGATPPSFKGTITYTLLRVEGSGNNRVAVLDQKMDATAAGPLPAPGAAPTAGGGAAGGGPSAQSGAAAGGLTMHMTGAGQVQVDLARGVARSGEIETTMEGTMKRGPGAPASPLMGGDLQLKGTTKMKMVTSPQAEDR